LDLEPGAVEAVKRRVLVDQLGTRLAGELGLRDEAEAVAVRRDLRRKPRDDGDSEA
jgi:hypothetical protein